MLEWKVRSKKIIPSFKDIEQGNSDSAVPKEHIVKYIREFDNFSTYFTGFNATRANVYNVSGAKSTSLINRIFVQNLQSYFENIKKWKIIKKSLERNVDIYAKKNYDWRAKLAECERILNFSMKEIVRPETFIKFMSQSGIDRYNCILGGQTGERGKTRIHGLNEFINLVRQQAGAKHNDFPSLQLFYKQILSKNNKTFIAAFEYDTEMFDAIKNFRQECFVDVEKEQLPLVYGFIKHMHELCLELKDEKKHIYITKDNLPYFSQELFGSRNTLRNMLLSEFNETAFNKKNSFPIADIEAIISTGIDGKNLVAKDFKDKYKSKNIFFDFFIKKSGRLIYALEEKWRALDANGVLKTQELDKTNKNAQVAYIKAFLDSANELLIFVKDWFIKSSLPKEANQEWQDSLKAFIDQFHIIELYNKVRNHVTKKVYSGSKVKVNFENSRLLDGWDRNTETKNNGVLLEKNGLYYLAIMTPESKKIFDYENMKSTSINKQQQKLAEQVLPISNESIYRKMNYKFIPTPNKMLPKVFFAASNKTLFKPSKRIIDIKNKKLYSKAEIEKNGTKNLYDYIDFCKKSLSIHPEWSSVFGFSENSFRKTSEYQSIDKFYKDVEMLGYKINFNDIKESYIDEKVHNGELYLFKIYNKDFSQNKKNMGSDNLHTSYWKLLFAEENLKDTVLKLDGNAEIFFRKATINLSEEKKKRHLYKEFQNTFNYPIIKNRRFTENKFFFHCPITLNFKAPSIPGKFNERVNVFLKKNPEVNIIGIDRGKTHLLYYSVVNQQGDILEQGSLNSIANGFIPRGEKEEHEINYQEKIKAREDKLNRARRSWSMTEKIKDTKVGYLSQVVHKLAELIINNNAIVVLENLNHGFKRGRFIIGQQVYHNFEKALISKLNYLVNKEKTCRFEAGHYLNAYQLTSKSESSTGLRTQNGIVFYVASSYSSSTDPVTGFLKNIYTKYESVGESLKFWKSFDSIRYNTEKDRFEFSYTLKTIISQDVFKVKDKDKTAKSQWMVCSSVIRSRYIKTELTDKQKYNIDSKEISKLDRHEVFCVNDELKKLFKEKEIDYRANPDIQKVLLEQNDASLHKSCLYYFNAIMTIRVINYEEEQGSDENDFIFSPVEPFFDSRDKHKDLPKNSDANGAYNIARMGICILERINRGEKLAVTKQIWQNYAQSDEIQERQILKLK